MITYWDHEEKDRAAMARDTVERYLDAELMSKGVLRVDPPELEEVPDAPDVPKTTWSRIELKNANYYSLRDMMSFAFPTAEAAQAFLALKPQRIHTGDCTYVAPIEEAGIVPTEASTHQDYLNNKSALESARAVTNRNEAAECDFREASKKMNDVLRGVWDDWASCREKAAEHKRVIDTYDAYVETAGGDGAIAWVFLLKAFDPSTVETSYKWFDQEVPHPIPVPAE